MPKRSRRRFVRIRPKSFARRLSRHASNPSDALQSSADPILPTREDIPSSPARGIAELLATEFPRRRPRIHVYEESLARRFFFQTFKLPCRTDPLLRGGFFV